jgi:hypothetical protein
MIKPLFLTVKSIKRGRMTHSEGIIDFLDENFNEKKCHELCRQYKFIQRSSSKLKGHEFIKTMIMPSDGVSIDSLKGLCKRMQKFNPEADLSAQALCQRINKESSSRLMKGVLAEILGKIHKSITKSCQAVVEGLNAFDRVLLQDSTVASLNEHLEDAYKGTTRGKNCVKSQVKIDLIHDLGSGLLVDAQIVSGNKPDQSLSERIVHFIKAGDLIIRDLGYFGIKIFQTVAIIGAYFLSRYKAGVNFYLNEDDKEALNIGAYLNDKKRLRKNVLELKGYLGNEKIPVRMIIYRQTEEVTNQRLRVANKNARKKGETMSANKKLLLHFTIFVTNAPEEMILAEIVGTVYRLRWEIELVFKRWKSQLQVDYLEGIHKERIDCLIWARLCTVIIIELIIGYFKNIVCKLFKVELSEVKLIQYLMRGNDFCSALAMNNLELFFKKMEKDISRMLLKDKRNRKTMRERVSSRESYYGV